MAQSNGQSNGRTNGQTNGHADAPRAETPETPVPMKGAQMVWEALVREGVSVVFGHPGGAILPTYDALSPYEAEGRIHHVLVRHEQCAGHMADGYARATGRVGVCGRAINAVAPNSPIDTVKAKMAPTSRAGKMIGKSTARHARSGEAP